MAYLGEQSAPRDSKTIIEQQGYMLDLGKMMHSVLLCPVISPNSSLQKTPPTCDASKRNMVSLNQR